LLLPRDLGTVVLLIESPPSLVAWSCYWFCDGDVDDGLERLERDGGLQRPEVARREPLEILDDEREHAALLAPAVALDSEMIIVGPGGRRTVPAAEFFVDLFTTAVRPDEVLVEVRIPKKTGWGAHYEKFNRVAQAWSIVAVAAAVRTEGGSIAQARVALTNMGATPIRALGVEQALIGQQANAETIRAAAEHAAEGTRPVSDGNADADYREHPARVLTGRAVAAAAGGGG